jgi:ribonuclease J
MSEKSNKSRLDKSMNALSKQSHKQQPKPNYAAGSKPTKYKRPKKNQPAQSLPFHYQTGGRQTGRRQKQRRAPKARPLRISFLGGINEVGKNMTVFEYENDMIIVDSGLAFPDEDMLGIDLVIPDFTYIKENADKLRGVVITHGHEDHIGSLAYLLKEINVPVYATRLTVGLIKGKLEEHKLLSSARLNEVSPGEHVTLGGFDVEFIHVNHSIPDAVGFAIRCGAGTVIHPGDFKIDATPIDGGMIDLARFGQLGSEGVLCMLADSTNAERPGFTESERKVGESFERLFKNAGDRRIIIATFASNIHRVQQIIDVAQKEGRKVALSGRSLENVVAVSRELGYLKVPDNVLIPLDLIHRYSAKELVLITTGSQGEPMSALTRMALSDHRKVMITPNDYVIISATPIPGNEKTVGRVVNELMKLGAEVVYERMYEVHVSGHACQEELKLMLSLIHPRFFIPVHGEQKHLQKHAGLARAVGMDPNDILIVDNGVQVEVQPDKIKKCGSVPAGQVFVDGSGVGDVGSVVIRDRKHLAEDGIIIIAAGIDHTTGYLTSGPDVVSRGFVYVRESEDLIEEIKRTATKTILKCYDRNIREYTAIKNRIRDDVSRLIYERTKRSPMILPIFLETD